ncbi:uncharacterized protein LOC143217537 [Lasioglossum baleicum]|uniref:uncharacterized protein LOC143217537 n=1 Tax=Lasioglossum baleicum TaxID=434251 RepID=UPI003FCE36E4
MSRNKQLSQVDRLHYLKSSLHDEAADLVRDLPTTNENYERAWTILKEQYENKRILVRACLDRLASLPKMRESSAQELTNIHKGIISVVYTLEGLGRPIDRTEDWFVYSVVNLFEPITRDKWEERVTSSSEPASFATLKDFMTKRRQQLDASSIGSASKSVLENHGGQTKKKEARSNQGQSSCKGTNRTARNNHAQRLQNPACVKCKREHYLMQCPDYKALPPADRRGYVERARLCINCLGNHQIAACPSTRNCMSCNERHHSSLHDAFRDGAKQTTVHHNLDCRNERGKILLATAIINVADHYGRKHRVRALIDQGSEISMLSEGLAQRLQLPRASSTVDIFGVGGQQLAKARGQVTLTISTNKTADTIKVTAIVLPRLTDYTHGYTGPRRNWVHLEGLELADPVPSRASPIEVLLGADVYPAIMNPGVRKGAPNEPIGQLTVFGWIITGMAGASVTPSQAQVHQVIVSDSLSSLVRRFWEQEEIQETHSTPTAEELECEKHYVATHSRTPEGRYRVRLPFRQLGPVTPGTRTASWHALRRMEQRFKRDENFKTLYRDFVSEYELLGHMTLASEPANEKQAHYLPHHGVLKLSSSTTKLRVVFNGSWAEPSQLSLNDCLHVGPNLLPLLADTLLRWRRHLYVVTADVTKMYRQILVHPEDRDHQRILWRNDETHHVSEFNLNTVTYGLSCAPYLAVRTMHQLAADEGIRYPRGAAAIKQDSYVDDVLTGADSIPVLKETVVQLKQLCLAGGFPLQKWASNVADLHVIPQSCQNSAIQSSSHQDEQAERKTWTDATHSALGLQWSPHEDTFHFFITNTETLPTTKRGVVSKAAQLFDPLGWLTPVVVRAKITIQSTWVLGLGWDDPLPPQLTNDWSSYCSELQLLEKVRVPRPLFHSSSPIQKEFHGFADASERAYGAVVYLRTRNAGEQWTTTLVTAKSKRTSSHDWFNAPSLHSTSVTPQFTYGPTPRWRWAGSRHTPPDGKRMWQIGSPTSREEFQKHSGTT